MERTDGFICYSRKDKEFALKLEAALEAAGWDIFIDKELKGGLEWNAQLLERIEYTDNLLVLISPDSVGSRYCISEIETAQEFGKRLVPVHVRKTPSKDVHDAVRKLHFFNFLDADQFDEAFAELNDFLRTDLDYIREHTRLTTKATEWHESKDNARLLRGSELAAAQHWLANTSDQSYPEPTQLQRDFIGASAQRKARQRSWTIAGTIAATLVMVGLGIVLWWQSSEALASQFASLQTVAASERAANPHYAFRVAEAAYQLNPDAPAGVLELLEGYYGVPYISSNANLFGLQAHGDQYFVGLDYPTWGDQYYDDGSRLPFIADEQWAVIRIIDQELQTVDSLKFRTKGVTRLDATHPCAVAFMQYEQQTVHIWDHCTGKHDSFKVDFPVAVLRLASTQPLVAAVSDSGAFVLYNFALNSIVQRNAPPTHADPDWWEVQDANFERNDRGLFIKHPYELLAYTLDGQLQVRFGPTGDTTIEQATYWTDTLIERHNLLGTATDGTGFTLITTPKHFRLYDPAGKVLNQVDRVARCLPPRQVVLSLSRNRGALVASLFGATGPPYECSQQRAYMPRLQAYYGNTELSLEGLPAAPTAIDASSTGRFVVAGSHKGNVMLWRIDEDGPYANTPPPRFPLAGHANAVSDVVFANKQNRFMTKGSNSTRLWRTADGSDYMRYRLTYDKRAGRYRGESPYAQPMIRQDSLQWKITKTTGDTFLVDLSRAAFNERIDYLKRSWSADSSYLAVYGEGKGFMLINRSSGHVQAISPGSGSTDYVAFVEREDRMVSVANERCILWDLQQDTIIPLYDFDVSQMEHDIPLNVWTQRLIGAQLFIGTEQGTLLCWDIPQDRVEVVAEIGKMITAIDWNPQLKRLVLGVGDEVRLYETDKTCTAINLLWQHKFDGESGVYEAELSPDGKWIAAMPGFDDIHLFSTKNYQAIRLHEPFHSFDYVHFSPDSRFVLGERTMRYIRHWPIDPAWVLKEVNQKKSLGEIPPLTPQQRFELGLD